MSTLKDAEARRRIREDLATTFVVEAAAGTGKTTALIARIVAAIDGGAHLDRMVAVTFTDKAAGEMKLRLRESLEDARRDAPDEAARGRFVGALRALELAYVGTIHGFCGELLRERPVEAKIDPAFEMCAEEEVDRFVGRVFDAWFQRVLAEPPPGVARVLHMRRWGRDGGPRQMLRKALRDVVERRDYSTAWKRPEFDREARAAKALAAMREVGALAAASDDERDYLRKSLELIHRFVREVDAREASLQRRTYDDSAAEQRDRAQLLDRFEADLRTFAPKSKPQWKWRGYGKSFGEHDKQSVVDQRDAAHAVVEAFVIDAEQDLAASLQQELLPLVAEYEDLKRRSGRLDFLDLLIEARNLLRDHQGVRASLQERFTHIFVDEFQDTDPVQVELLFLLAATDPSCDDWRQVKLHDGKLFVVGDPKQAVYRFRRADLVVYEQAKQSVIRAGGEVLDLVTSFRSVPSLQRFINGAFEARMGEGEAGSQARYVALAEHRPEPEAQPSVIALPIPAPYGAFGVNPWMSAVEASTPDPVGAFIHWLVRESGWKVGEHATPVAYGDIALLFTRMATPWNDVTTPYVQALSARSIPHVLHGGRSFYEREEIAALRQVVGAIEWPDDPLAVFATLRGPFLGLDDATLFGFRAKVRDRIPREHHAFHPFSDRSGIEFVGAEAEVDAALTLLAELHITRNRRPIADTLAAFLEAARVHAGLAFWPAPRQTLANVARLVDHARRIDGRGATSFRAFIAWVDEQAERSAASDAGVVDDGEGGVRLMTVHKAKGLEFPVVILCDPTAKETRLNPSRFVDSDKKVWAMPLCQAVPADVRDHQEAVKHADHAERIRVAYVAATRARDLLVVPAVGDDPLADSWLSTLYAGLYPADRAAAQQAPGCPRFEGDDTVLERNEKVHQAGYRPVVPGMHRVGDVDIVWWDPAALGDEPARVEMRRQVLLEPKGEHAQRGREDHSAWTQARSALLSRASAPSRPIQSVSERAAIEAPVGLGVTLASTGAWREDRPSGARFGTLVHAVLAEIPFDADAELIAALSGAQARLLGATEAETAACREAVAKALAHPLLIRAASSPRCRREVPLCHRRSDGTLVEGVVDLAFEDADPFGGSRWVVVDYKTDLDASGATDVYIVQVETYAQALAEATGAEVDGLLLGV